MMVRWFESIQGTFPWIVFLPRLSLPSLPLFLASASLLTVLCLSVLLVPSNSSTSSSKHSDSCLSFFNSSLPCWDFNPFVLKCIAGAHAALFLSLPVLSSTLTLLCQSNHSNTLLSSILWPNPFKLKNILVRVVESLYYIDARLGVVNGCKLTTLYAKVFFNLQLLTNAVNKTFVWLLNSISCTYPSHFQILFWPSYVHIIFLLWDILSPVFICSKNLSSYTYGCQVGILSLFFCLPLFLFLRAQSISSCPLLLLTSCDPRISNGKVLSILAVSSVIITGVVHKFIPTNLLLSTLNLKVILYPPRLFRASQLCISPSEKLKILSRLLKIPRSVRQHLAPLLLLRNFLENSIVDNFIPSEDPQFSIGKHLCAKLYRTSRSRSVRRKISFGPQFSSDDAGDGPVPEPGSIVYVEYSTFGRGWIHPPSPLVKADFVVRGRYEGTYRAGTRIVFDALGRWVHYADPSWIQSHGSIKATTKAIITKQLFEAWISPQLAPRQLGEHGLNGPGIERPEYLIFDEEVADHCRVYPQDFNKNFGIGTFNLNSLCPEFDFPLLGWMCLRYSLNVLAVIDTRLSPRSYSSIRQKWSELHPGGKVYFGGKGLSPTGGCAIFVDGTVGPLVTNFHSDPSDLGIVSTITFGSKEHPLRISAVYWPIAAEESDDNHRLDSCLQRWLSSIRPGTSSSAYIQEQIECQRIKKSSFFATVGDFNAQIGSECINRLQENGLIDAHAGSPTVIYSRYSGLIPTSKIDHILSTLPSRGFGFFDNPPLGDHSDHRPIFAYYKLALPQPSNLPALASPPRYKTFSFQDDEKISEIQRVLLNQLDNFQGSADDQLFAITTSIVKEFRYEPPRRLRQLWSPPTMMFRLWRQMSLAIKHQTPAFRLKTFKYYSVRAAKSCKPGKELWSQLASQYPSVVTWSVIDCNRMVAKCNQELHGSKRRTRIENFRLASQHCYDKQNTGRLFRSLGNKRQSPDLSTIEEDHLIHSCPYKIHQLLTDNFRRWFSDPSPHRDRRNYWERAQQMEALREDYPDIPIEQLAIFHQVLLAPSEKRGQVEQELSTLLSGPTWDQFKKELEAASNRSAGGPSGLTYGMLKHSPEPLIQKIYECLLELWKSKAIPKWLKSKLLCPIPKAEQATTPDTVRPIMLIEVIRKLWVGAIIRQIRSAWESSRILNPAQYGFRSGRSTHSAIIQLVNNLEGSAEEDQSLFFSSWDIKRAFDSIPRWVIEVSLRRLGVPSAIASYLSFIDEGDEIRVLSPLGRTGGGDTFSTERKSNHMDCSHGHNPHSPLHLSFAILDHW